MNWADSFPVGFQVWQSPSSRFIIPTSVSYNTQKSRNRFDDYIYQISTDVQPMVGNNSCAAVIAYSNTRLRWITVPCDRQFKRVLVLCEKRQRYGHKSRNMTTQSSTISEYELRQIVECPYGWTHSRGVCYRLVHVNVSNVLSCSVLQTFCQTLDERAGIVKKSLMSNHLLWYLRQWLQSPKQDTFYVMDTNGNTTTCIATTFEEAEYPTISLQSKDRTYGSVEAQSVFCERATSVTTSECLDNQFTCNDSTCILAHYFCDGLSDCPDSSDESSCENGCEFALGTPRVSITVEPSCFNECFPDICTCSYLYFHCKWTGKCVALSKLCDGHIDCKEKEDELFCERQRKSHKELHAQSTQRRSSSGWTDVTMFMYKKHGHACGQNYTNCAKPPALDASCFPQYKVCLFEVDSIAVALRFCPHGEHLHGCINHTCPSDFKCHHELLCSTSLCL